jgi:hypothetical protein
MLSSMTWGEEQVRGPETWGLSHISYKTLETPQNSLSLCFLFLQTRVATLALSLHKKAQV